MGRGNSDTSSSSRNDNSSSRDNGVTPGANGAAAAAVSPTANSTTPAPLSPLASNGGPPCLPALPETLLRSSVARAAATNPTLMAAARSRTQQVRMRSLLDSTFTLAAEMQHVLSIINAECGTRVRMRVGVHVGSVVTGVVGRTRPRFHVYGPAVLTAERMEHTGREGEVHCSADAQAAYVASTFNV